MADLAALRADIAGRFKKRGRINFWGIYSVKLVLIVGGSLLATVAQIKMLPPDAVISSWVALGIGGAALVGLGGVFIALTERNPFVDLEQARRALEAATSREIELDSNLEIFDEVEQETARLRELYNAMTAMRAAVQEAIIVPTGGEDETIVRLLNTSARPLLLASNFKLPHHWTLCVYRATEDSKAHRTVLSCVARHRSAESEETPREWPEGVGVAGAAYSRGMEIIIPNLLDSALGTSYQLPRLLEWDYDRSRYRSIVAAPVNLPQVERPWGVVTATSSEPGHFTPDDVPGVRTVEGARALAGMVALAVLACRARPAPADATPQAAVVAAPPAPAAPTVSSAPHV